MRCKRELWVVGGSSGRESSCERRLRAGAGCGRERRALTSGGSGTKAGSLPTLLCTSPGSGQFILWSLGKQLALCTTLTCSSHWSQLLANRSCGGDACRRGQHVELPSSPLASAHSSSPAGGNHSSRPLVCSMETCYGTDPTQGPEAPHLCFKEFRAWL